MKRYKYLRVPRGGSVNLITHFGVWRARYFSRWVKVDTLYGVYRRLPFWRGGWCYWPFGRALRPTVDVWDELYHAFRLNAHKR